MIVFAVDGGKTCKLTLQAPGVAKARMFRVLKEVAENKLKGTKSTDKVARHA